MVGMLLVGFGVFKDRLLDYYSSCPDDLFLTNKFQTFVLKKIVHTLVGQTRQLCLYATMMTVGGPNVTLFEQGLMPTTA